MNNREKVNNPQTKQFVPIEAQPVNTDNIPDNETKNNNNIQEETSETPPFVQGSETPTQTGTNLEETLHDEQMEQTEQVNTNNTPESIR